MTWKQDYHTHTLPLTRLYDSDFNSLMTELSPRFSDYYRNTANEFSVHCIVKEKYANPIDLTITVPDEAQAKTACNNWRKKCQEIYEFVMKELL